MKIIMIIIALLILREIAAYIFGWKAGNPLADHFAIVKHNRAIERKWRENGRPVVSTTIGWRPDPYGKQDGFRNNGDGSYSKLLRGGTQKYKETFAADVEKTKNEPTPLDDAFWK